MDSNLLKDRYYGSLAATYEQERVNTPLWRNEQAAVEGMLAKFPAGTSVLSAPIGTGRFLHVYREYSMQVTGFDASAEMLAQAHQKADKLGLAAAFHRGDLRRLPFKDESFDLTVCIRFLNWIGRDDLRTVFHELTRVTRSSILLGIRNYSALSDLRVGSIHSIKEHLLQLKLRLYQARTRSERVYHEASTVETVFEENGLRVSERVRIPTKLPCEYHIYHLVRAG